MYKVSQLEAEFKKKLITADEAAAMVKKDGFAKVISDISLRS